MVYGEINIFQCFSRFIFLLQCLEHFDYFFLLVVCYFFQVFEHCCVFRCDTQNCKIFNIMREKKKVETLCTKSKHKVLILFICSFRVFCVERKFIHSKNYIHLLCLLVAVEAFRIFLFFFVTTQLCFLDCIKKEEEKKKILKLSQVQVIFKWIYFFLLVLSTIIKWIFFSIISWNLRKTIQKIISIILINISIKTLIPTE